MKMRWATILLFTGLTVLMGRMACRTGGMKSDDKDVNALFLMSKNYGLNYFLLRDVLDQYGWKVTHAGVMDTITPCPPVIEWGVPSIVVDVKVPEISNLSRYDCLVIPPGTGSYYKIPDSFDDLLKSPDALALISRAAGDGLPVFAMCAGVRVLAAANVIQNKKITGSPRFQEEYERAGAIYLGGQGVKHPPVIDDPVITATNGQQYSVGIGQVLATAVENRRNWTGPKKMSKREFIVSHPYDAGPEDVVWAKTLGGLQADGGHGLCQTDDGGYLLTGYTFSQGSGDADILVIKTDSDGNIIWSKAYGGAGTEYGYGCIAVANGYLVVGYTTSFGTGSKDVYLIKIDPEGEMVWAKTFGGSHWDVGTSACETGDGHYVVCGFTHSFGSGDEDIYVIKTDADGNEVWSRTYGGSRSDMGNSIFSLNDGGLLVGATTTSYGDKTGNAYLMKLDAEGRQILAHHYGNSGPRGYGYDWCKAMHPTENGGAVLVGYTDSQDILDVYVVRVDADGEESWSSRFGKKPFYDYGNSVYPAGDGGFIVCGTTKSIPGDDAVYDNDISVTKLDNQGNVIWEKTFGRSGTDWGNAVVVTERGEIVVLGHTDGSGSGFLDVCLLKVSDQE
jgi:putative intracellular protease/amidase